MCCSSEWDEEAGFFFHAMQLEVLLQVLERKDR